MRDIIPYGFRRNQTLGFFHHGSLWLCQFVGTLPDGRCNVEIKHPRGGHFYAALHPDHIVWSDNAMQYQKGAE